MCFFSDQVDPFNRQPLTLDMVIPNMELKDRVQEWLKEHKKEPSSEDLQPSTDDLQPQIDNLRLSTDSLQSSNKFQPLNDNVIQSAENLQVSA